MVFMQEFRGKRMMGHAFRRCGFKIKVKWKGIGKKKMQFSGLLFFLSILEAGASAVAPVGLGPISLVHGKNNIFIKY